MKKLVLLLAMLVLVAAAVGAVTGKAGWKWHATAAESGPPEAPDGFTWDPGPQE